MLADEVHPCARRSTLLLSQSELAQALRVPSSEWPPFDASETGCWAAQPAPAFKINLPARVGLPCGFVLSVATTADVIRRVIKGGDGCRCSKLVGTPNPAKNAVCGHCSVEFRVGVERVNGERVSLRDAGYHDLTAAEVVTALLLGPAGAHNMSPAMAPGRPRVDAGEPDTARDRTFRSPPKDGEEWAGCIAVVSERCHGVAAGGRRCPALVHSCVLEGDETAFHVVEEDAHAHATGACAAHKLACCVECPKYGAHPAAQPYGALSGGSLAAAAALYRAQATVVSIPEDNVSSPTALHGAALALAPRSAMLAANQAHMGTPDSWAAAVAAERNRRLVCVGAPPPAPPDEGGPESSLGRTLVGLAGLADRTSDNARPQLLPVLSVSYSPTSGVTVVLCCPPVQTLAFLLRGPVLLIDSTGGLVSKLEGNFYVTPLLLKVPDVGHMPLCTILAQSQSAQTTQEALGVYKARFDSTFPRRLAPAAVLMDHCQAEMHGVSMAFNNVDANGLRVELEERLGGLLATLREQGLLGVDLSVRRPDKPLPILGLNTMEGFDPLPLLTDNLVKVFLCHAHLLRAVSQRALYGAVFKDLPMKGALVGLVSGGCERGAMVNRLTLAFAGSCTPLVLLFCLELRLRPVTPALPLPTPSLLLRGLAFLRVTCCAPACRETLLATQPCAAAALLALRPHLQRPADVVPHPGVLPPDAAAVRAAAEGARGTGTGRRPGQQQHLRAPAGGGGHGVRQGGTHLRAGGEDEGREGAGRALVRRADAARHGISPHARRPRPRRPALRPVLRPALRRALRRAFRRRRRRG